jgi:hypothetical protein
MTKTSIPSIDREEWKKMITGEVVHNYRNFVLQLQLSQARKDVSTGKISLDEAVSKIHELCSKYAPSVKNDFMQIFKTW